MRIYFYFFREVPSFLCVSIAKIAALRRKVRGHVSEPAARSQGENVERFLVGGVRPRNACAYMYCTTLPPSEEAWSLTHSDQ